MMQMYAKFNYWGIHAVSCSEGARCCGRWGEEMEEERGRKIRNYRVRERGMGERVGIRG